MNEQKEQTPSSEEIKKYMKTLQEVMYLRSLQDKRAKSPIQLQQEKAHKQKVLNKRRKKNKTAKISKRKNRK